MRSPVDRPPWLRQVPPVCDEISMVDLEVRGHLPSAMAGRYVRIGPNALGPDAGCGGRRAPMVHAVTIVGGRAVGYRNRWVVTDLVARTLGADPVAGPADAHGCLTALRRVHGGLVATGPGPIAYDLGVDLTTTRKRRVEELPTDDNADPGPSWRLVDGVAVRREPGSGAEERYVGCGWLGDLVEVPDAASRAWLVGLCHPQHEPTVRLSVWPIGEPGEPVAEVVVPRAIPPATHAVWIPHVAPWRRLPTGRAPR